MARQSKQELIDAIGDEFRVNQNRADVFDEMAAEHLGINRTDMRCLDVLTRVGRTTAGDLAREAGLTTGGATAAVDRLERAGYVSRVRDDEDRRRVWIEATPVVLERAMEIWGPLKELWDGRAGALSREQLEFVFEFMRDSNAMMVDQIERVRTLRKRAETE